MGFDWSDQADEAVQNQALMAEIGESSSSEIPTQVTSQLCSKNCLETVKKYRDQNQTMSDTIKKLEKERREYVLVVENLEDQIKAYKANELQAYYDRNYWKWEKQELEKKVGGLQDELNKTKADLEKAQEDLDKFSKSSKALEAINKAQVTDEKKSGIGYHQTPPPYNQNYIPPTSDLRESVDRKDLPEGIDRVDPIETQEESENKKDDDSIPLENHILTNEKGGMPFIPSKEVKATREEKGKKVDPETKKKQYTQRTVVDPVTSSQSHHSVKPRGNQRNWNNHWAQTHGVDLNKINRPKPCFICCKLNHLAKDCYYNPKNQRSSFQKTVFQRSGFQKPVFKTNHA
ncbi:hypothetical protein, partial [Escherichia coli]|uniref:hypothetical protein n=1 Tax=Escherichia coli TaxID=562 RepID=UPI002022F92B